MRRLFALPCIMALWSCRPSPAATAPAPLAFHSARSATEATQVVAVALLNAGFRVVQTDSVGQSLMATRTATHNGNQPYVVCGLPPGSIAASNRETTLTIDFKARPSTSGSDVSLDSKVVTSYPGYVGTSMQSAPNEKDCVSTGSMEQELEAALR